ncbi:MAG TPA: hypothetical protein VNH18_29475 [Bryobacteraceae bacterium]|nr:hypothetical protein [Blastocatellia bacterium]HXJ43449.1 hypothetical protein [Bryobacteraceae bacterium]
MTEKADRPAAVDPPGMTIMLWIAGVLLLATGVILLFLGDGNEKAYGIAGILSGFPFLGLASIIHWLARIEFRLRPREIDQPKLPE